MCKSEEKRNNILRSRKEQGFV
ncbi:hypothetical protein FG05_35055 [Fusarium graminearum]|nr:hypothetical protein FG05_35055 [Fusarium graminearum]